MMIRTAPLERVAQAIANALPRPQRGLFHGDRRPAQVLTYHYAAAQAALTVVRPDPPLEDVIGSTWTVCGVHVLDDGRWCASVEAKNGGRFGRAPGDTIDEAIRNAVKAAQEGT